VVGG
jgi:hypothetical protein